MAAAVFICQTDGTCERHGSFIYFCYECHKEWRATEAGQRFIREQEILAGCTCTPTAGPQDDCPVHGPEGG